MKYVVIDGVNLKVVNEICSDRWGKSQLSMKYVVIDEISLKVVNEICSDRWGKSQSCQ
jgi:hypothetical protein